MELVLYPLQCQVPWDILFVSSPDVVFHQMVHITFQQTQRVRWIAIEADVDKELSQFMWHLISGRFGHGIFSDSVVFQQIQRDSSQLENGVLYAFGCL